MYEGKDILAVAEQHIGETYDQTVGLGVANSHRTGSWDCADFASWCAYQTYGIVFGVHPPNPRTGEPFTGYWVQDAAAQNAVVDVQQAMRTPGAFLLRKANAATLTGGHIAISRGDGTTIEARGKDYGVGIFKAAGRKWSMGVQLPGVLYTQLRKVPMPESPPVYYELSSPYMRGKEVFVIQMRLAQAGFSPGKLDGCFGTFTEDAVRAFQASKGVVPDGEVGPDTAGALGLPWPITLTEAEEEAYEQAMATPGGVTYVKSLDQDDPVPRPGHADPHDAGIATFEFEEQDRRFYALQPNGEKFYVGYRCKYNAAGGRVGLSQNVEHLGSSLKTYDPEDYAKSLGLWSHFLQPTIMAESAGFFERVNSYDTAAFTFGCYQLGAHTPDDNLILFFRKLLALPTAPDYFPELCLRPDGQSKNRVFLRKEDGRLVNLETETKRSDGSKRLKHFMDYLNPDPKEVGDAELVAAARLMLWCRKEPQVCTLQVQLAAELAEKKLRETKANVSNLNLGDWRQAIWISDIRHQGRGKYHHMREALKKPDPLAALAEIGADNYPGRARTVQTWIKKLEKGKKLDGWKFPP